MCKSNLNSRYCQNLLIYAENWQVMDPREVVQHDSVPTNLLIHGLARMQNLSIFIFLKLSQRQKNSLGGGLSDTYLGGKERHH